ncbi:integrase family protein [Rhizobium sp. N541]|nr:integrase family protein [Rhizobium sp. N541]ANM23315.1 integrase family protein [Rhizobium sp. N941]
MPRRHKGPHLILRKARRDKDGRITHQAVWIIKDGDTQRSTGCGVDDRKGAEVELHNYLVGKHADDPTGGETDASKVLIADLIAFYLTSKADWIAAKDDGKKREFLSEIECLNSFWGNKTVSEIHEKTSLDYQKGKNPNVVRKKLEILRSIVNFGEFKGKVDKGGRRLDYAMPSKPKSRIHFYSRGEVARLVWSAYRKKHKAEGFGEYLASVHIARFILTAVYTGTRSERIEEASFVKESGRPWLDLENGIYYRKADGEQTPTNKRADPVRIPKPLLMHMRRWQKGMPPSADGKSKRPGTTYLVEYQGRPVGVRKGFQTLKATVFGEGRAKEVNRHTFRHTCATWLMQAGVSVALVARYLSTTEKIIEEVYGHHHPDFQAEADHAFSRGKAGRGKEGRKVA